MTFQDLKVWLADHRVYALSAVNALIVLVLTCVVAVILEVSATQETYAEARDQCRVRGAPAPADGPVKGVGRHAFAREAEVRAPGARRTRAASTPNDRRVEIRERSANTQGPPPVWSEEEPNGGMAGPPEENDPPPDRIEEGRIEDGRAEEHPLQ